MSGSSNMRWQLIGWLFLLSAISYLDRVNLSIAGGTLAHDYGLSRQQLSWILGAFTAGYALCQAPAGRVADVLGPRRTLAIAAVWWAVFSSLSAAVPVGPLALGLFLGIRFSLGVGEATMYPASNRVVARWIPVRERGIATGLIFTGVGIGTALAAPLVTTVMLRYGWRASFPVCGVLGLFVGAAWFLIARDTPEQSARVSAAERVLIREGISPRVTAPPLAWRDILLNRDVALLTIAYFCYGYSAYIFFNWFFTYLSTLRHLELHATARYAMLPGLGMALGSCCGGWINDRLTKRYGPRVGRCFFASAAVTLAAVFIAHWTDDRRRATRRGDPRRRGGHTLSGAKLVLVRQRGHRGSVRRSRFRCDEHGGADRRFRHHDRDAMDRRPLRLVGIVLYCGRPLHRGGSRMGSRPAGPRDPLIREHRTARR